MATIAFEAYYGATPAWTDIAANRLVFCGSLTDLTVTILATNFQTGTHVGTATPGTDVCTTTHCNNVKWLTDTTMSVNGAASEIINDTNLADLECTMRIHFNDATAYAIQNMRFYCYNNTTTTTEATGLDVWLPTLRPPRLTGTTSTMLRPQGRRAGLRVALGAITLGNA